MHNPRTEASYDPSVQLSMVVDGFRQRTYDLAMTERRRYILEILRDPASDLARLAYADWLDEHGGAAQAAYIRDSIAWYRNELRGSRPFLPTEDTVHPFHIARWRRDVAEFSLARHSAWTDNDLITVRFLRGFVHYAEFGSWKCFRRDAKAVFRRFPVTSASIQRVRPAQYREPATFPFHWYDREMSSLKGEPANLFRSIFAMLKDGFLTTHGAARSYASLVEAYADLSQALVQYGLIRAGIERVS